MKTEEKTYTLMDYFKALKYRNNDKESSGLAKGMMARINDCRKSRNVEQIAELKERLEKCIVLKDATSKTGNKVYVVEKINVPQNLRDYFLAPTDKQKTKMRNSQKTNKAAKCKTVHTARVCKSNPTFCR